MVVLRLLEGHHRELDLCHSSLPSSAPTSWLQSGIVKDGDLSYFRWYVFNFKYIESRSTELFSVPGFCFLENSCNTLTRNLARSNGELLDEKKLETNTKTRTMMQWIFLRSATI
ncbi:hypothetical protein SORBI_3004G127132 [Sorghum bicolor]|uniref:Uncharacterized protein n=1 Tax=Sorghum bicolor TaxID=4558 RepID=A0A1Z5RMJ1_SORBI|nr:hypothetical protein SORBI_3004G127132 [Sorghum bicolor]